jgi:hypothetical protein
MDGVSECIIMGMPMSIGTGLFKLLHRYVIIISHSNSININIIVFKVQQHHHIIINNGIIFIFALTIISFSDRILALPLLSGHCCSTVTDSTYLWPSLRRSNFYSWVLK